MKYIWNTDDIKAGMIVCRSETLAFEKRTNANKADKVDGWDAKWTYQIGWLASGESRISKASQRRDFFVLISMADGMVMDRSTREEVVSFLNENNMAPMSREACTVVFEMIRDSHARDFTAGNAKAER